MLNKCKKNFFDEFLDLQDNLKVNYKIEKLFQLILNLNYQLANVLSHYVIFNTMTSYNPDSEGLSSGKSGADVERILAFNSIGRKDPIKYVKKWDEILSDALEIEKKYIER